MKSRYTFRTTSHGVGVGAQKGIATILVVVLMGISMTAMALGLIFSVKSTQEKQVAVHATTHTQVGLWSGVEAFRRYLGAIPVADLANLGNVTQFSIDTGSGYGSTTAKDITVTPVGALYHVAVTIVNWHADAESSSAVGVMFEIDPGVSSGGGGGSMDPTAVINFYDSLELEGALNFKLPDNAGAKVNVEGNVSMTNINSAVNLKEIKATGNISISSGVNLDLIHAVGNVLLGGSAHINTVLSEGNVETVAYSSAGADVIWANKTVILGSAQRSESVNALETITVNQGSHGKLNAKGNVILTGGGTTDEVETKSDVNITGPGYSGGTLKSAIAEGNMNCSNSNWGTIVSLSINGTVNAKCGSGWPAGSVGANNSVTVMNPVTPFTMPPLVIDVWKLKDKANYIVEYVGGKTKVTVNNINGVTKPTDFYLGYYQKADYTNTPKKYLCSAVDASGKCTAPSSSTMAMKLCSAQNEGDACISYKSIQVSNLSGGASAMGWEINATNAGAAPGVMWFAGNVAITNGVMYTTILATGNVITSGGVKVYSPNYSGYNGVCSVVSSSASLYTSSFSNQYPTNLCNKAESQYTSASVANIGIASGGYTGDPAVFSGGRIELAGTTEIFGSVLAGHSLNTAGTGSVVHGYVTAAAQGGKVAAGLIANTLKSGIKIDLTNSIDSYDGTDIPIMSDAVPAPLPTPSGPASDNFKDRSKILWSRYL